MSRPSPAWRPASTPTPGGGAPRRADGGSPASALGAPRRPPPPDWETDKFEPPSSFTQIDPVVYANNVIGGPHSIEWNGWIWTEEPGDYTFYTFSDDGSFVFIDGRMVVDNGGTRGAQQAEGTRPLGRGLHR